MSMDLDSCCRLAQDILGVEITPLDNPIQQSAFCTRNQFHPAQTYLLPQQFGRMIDALPEGEILSLIDLFRVRYLFFRLQGVAVGIGPFCTEFFSLNDCQILLRQAGLRDLTAQDLLIRRGICPVQPESSLMHLARSLARALGLGGALHNVRRLQLDHPKQEGPSDLHPRRLYAELVNERYQKERLFMDYIRRGDANAAMVSTSIETGNLISKLHHSGRQLFYDYFNTALPRWDSLVPSCCQVRNKKFSIFFSDEERHHPQKWAKK